MRGVILRETDILNRALKGGIEKKPIDSIRVLSKHYLFKEDVDTVISKINEFMENNYVGYKPSKWRELIENTVKTIKKTNNFKLVDIDSVAIYESEWECIIALEDRQLEKLAFILLVYQKINEIKNNDRKGWINNTLTDIFKEASVGSKLKPIQQKMLLNKLYQLQYIKQKNTVDATSLKINYRELDTNKEIKFKVDNLNHAITYYYEYRDDVKYINCEICNKRIVKKNNRMKYCNKCAKDINNKKALDYYYSI